MLTIARTLGEFGAVIMVSSNLPGTSQTLTLLVSDRYSRGNEYGAYAVVDAADGRGGVRARRPGDPRRPACPGGKIGFEKETT